MSHFTGFPQSLPEYFSALSKNNQREWFEENKSDYETLVKQPALQFIEAIALFVEKLTPPHKAEPRMNGSLRRIHRDTRFSKDKTPYNPRLHLVFWTGDHPNRSAGIHVVISASHFGIGAGHWGFEKHELENYRSAILDAKARKSLEKALIAAQAEGMVQTEPPLKKIPKGFEDAGDLARRKGMVVMNSREEGLAPQLFTPDCVDYVSARMKACLPLQAWLMQHVYK